MLETNQITKEPLRYLLIMLMIFTLVIGVVYANKSVRAFIVLENSRELGYPETGNIRGWMTLQHIISQYKIPQNELLRALNLKQQQALSITISDLAIKQGLDTIWYIKNIQKSLSFSSVEKGSIEGIDEASFISSLIDNVFTYFLLYGYPILAIILLIGAFGLPVPAGPLTMFAGTLLLQDTFNGIVLFMVALISSLIGDLIAYKLGEKLGIKRLSQWGRWIKISNVKIEKVQQYFSRWGAVTLILTRSIFAQLSILASIIAGTNNYPMSSYLLYTLIGRVIWVAMYLGVGYVVGDHFEIASSLLGYISLAVISFLIFIVIVYLLKSQRYLKVNDKF